MSSIYIFTFWVFLACSLPGFSQQRPKDTDKDANLDPISIVLDNDSLSASFQDQPLHLVCQKITEKTGISVVLAEGLAEDLVTLSAQSQALDVSLRKLFANYDTFVFYGGSKLRPSALRAMWVYPKGGASDLRPVPRSDWAGVRELEVTLSDNNAAVREAAYVALLERSDSHSRGLVIDAIKGVSERDSLLRERLLSTAISKQLALPSEVLADLARIDPSEQIRWIALDALASSESPSARQVAEAATTDASEAIRSRAKEVLSQLNSDHREQRVETDAKSVEPGR